MAVGLRHVTGDNPDDLAELKVRDDQRSCVAPSVYSIAQAKVYPGWESIGAHADGEIVYRLALAGQGA